MVDEEDTLVRDTELGARMHTEGAYTAGMYPWVGRDIREVHSTEEDIAPVVTHNIHRPEVAVEGIHIQAVVEVDSIRKPVVQWAVHIQKMELVGGYNHILGEVQDFPIAQEVYRSQLENPWDLKLEGDYQACRERPETKRVLIFG